MTEQEKILQNLKNCWEKCPELRFGQLIVNIINVNDGELDHNLFFIENNALMKKTQEFERLYLN